MAATPRKPQTTPTEFVDPSDRDIGKKSFMNKARGKLLSFAERVKDEVCKQRISFPTFDLNSFLGLNDGDDDNEISIDSNEEDDVCSTGSNPTTDQKFEFTYDDSAMFQRNSQSTADGRHMLKSTRTPQIARLYNGSASTDFIQIWDIKLFREADQVRFQLIKQGKKTGWNLYDNEVSQAIQDIIDANDSTENIVFNLIFGNAGETVRLTSDDVISKLARIMDSFNTQPQLINNLRMVEGKSSTLNAKKDVALKHNSREKSIADCESTAWLPNNDDNKGTISSLREPRIQQRFIPFMSATELADKNVSRSPVQQWYIQILHEGQNIVSRLRENGKNSPVRTLLDEEIYHAVEGIIQSSGVTERLQFELNSPHVEGPFNVTAEEILPILAAIFK